MCLGNDHRFATKQRANTEVLAVDRVHDDAFLSTVDRLIAVHQHNVAWSKLFRTLASALAVHLNDVFDIDPLFGLASWVCEIENGKLTVLDRAKHTDTARLEALCAAVSGGGVDLQVILAARDKGGDHVVVELWWAGDNLGVIID